MSNRIYPKILMLVFAGISVLAQSPSIDSCEALLPLTLRNVLQAKFPGYRLARVTDYLQEDIDQHKKDHMGNPCLGVASADVDGDGFPDFAFFLTNKTKHTLLIAAQNVGGKTWQISKLYDFGNEGPGHLYVDSFKPGLYRDLFDTDRGPSDYTPEPGRVRKFKARHSGFIAGGIEASGVAFFFSGKQWVHLWLSD